MGKHALGLLVILAIAVSGAESGAVQAVPVTVTVQSNIWALNGDTVRQPLVPLLQKLDTPVFVLTDTAIVNPTKDAVTQLNIPSKFGGTQTVTVSQTTGGNQLLVANPTDRFNPFTARFTNQAFNDAGTATVFGGPNGGKGGEFPVNIFTRVVLDEIDAGGPFLFLEIPQAGEPPLQFGVKATVPFAGIVASLSIPVEGSAMATGWTTGTLTVTKAVTTMRFGGAGTGTPTGFQVFTFMSTGSFMQNVSSAVTPFVVEAFAGTGPNRVPTPFYGFLRSKIEGLTFVTTPEPGEFLLTASLAALGALGWKRWKSA